MAAKTQDAAGVLVRNNERVHYQHDANPGDRWMVTRDGEPRLWAESLYVIAQHLNLDIEEFNRCAALMEPPATPRETAIAAPTGETVRQALIALLDEARGEPYLALTEALGVEAFEPGTRMADNSVRVADALLAARVPAPSAPQEPGCTGLTARWCPRCGTCTCSEEYHALGGHASGCPLHDPASPHPIVAPQEPRGEPSEGMVERAARALFAERRPKSDWHRTTTAAQQIRRLYRDRARLALIAALSTTGGRDA